MSTFWGIAHFFHVRYAEQTTNEQGVTMSKPAPPPVSKIREAARQALAINDLLDHMEAAGVWDLMGFDLPYLASQLEFVANRLDTLANAPGAR